MNKIVKLQSRAKNKVIGKVPVKVMYDHYCAKAYKLATKQTDKEYIQLQKSWNEDILQHLMNHDMQPDRMIGIGAFLGLTEMALASKFKQVICVDHKNYLPDWAPENVSAHITDIDTGNWDLPTEGGMYDLALFIETIEHLRWSPLPILEWMKKYSHLSVISTPDDAEWPAMPDKPWIQNKHFSEIPRAKSNSKGNPTPMDHCKQYGQAEFIELLDHVGFRVLEFFRTGVGNHQMVAIVQPR